MLNKFFSFFSLNGIGQFFYGISGIVIVKFISIKNYGIACCILTFTCFCTLIATARYDIQILYEKNKDKRRECIITCCFLILVISTLCCFCGFCLRKFLFRGLSINFSTLSILFILIISSAFFELIIRKIYILKGNFKQLGYVLLSNYLMRGSFPLILLIFFDDWRCYIFGETFGMCATCGFFLLKNVELKAIKLDFKIIIRTLKAYKHCPIYQLPSTIFDNIAIASIIPAINFLFGNYIAGQFALVYRILLAPLSLLGKIIEDFYQHAVSVAVGFKNLSETLLQYTKILASCAMLIYSIICMMGFGVYKSWDNFEKYFYLWPIFICAIFQFIVSPLSVVLLANVKGMKYKMSYDVSKDILILLTFGITYWWQFNCCTCIKLLSLVFTITYIFYYLIIYYYVRNFRYTDN